MHHNAKRAGKLCYEGNMEREILTLYPEANKVGIVEEGPNERAADMVGDP